MKIGFISDLHTDVNREYPVMDTLAQAAMQQELDVLAIAGDISESPETTLREVEKLAACLETKSGCRLVYIPGNHDMWNKHCPGRDADEIYRKYCEDPRCLCGKAFALEAGTRSGGGADKAAGTAGEDYAASSTGKAPRRVFLIGDIGWYDYSLAYADYTNEQMEEMTWNGRTWQDKLYNVWTRDNAGKAAWFEERLRMQAAECRKQMQENDTLIVLTHMLPVRDFCVPQELPPGWGYFNGFLGSTGLGDVIRESGAAVAVCGHVHYRSTVNKDNILWICPCLGTFDEWPLFGIGETSLAGHIRNALYVMQI